MIIQLSNYIECFVMFQTLHDLSAIDKKRYVTPIILQFKQFVVYVSCLVKKKLKKYYCLQNHFFHDSSRKVMKNGGDSVWNIVKKGKRKACRNETCYIVYNFADSAVHAHYR